MGLSVRVEGAGGGGGGGKRGGGGLKDSAAMSKSSTGIAAVSCTMTNLDRVPHVSNLLIFGLCLPFELPDFVVQHEFELLELLVLLLEVVDALLFVPYGLIPLQQLLLVPQNVFLQPGNGLQACPPSVTMCPLAMLFAKGVIASW